LFFCQAQHSPSSRGSTGPVMASEEDIDRMKSEAQLENDYQMMRQQCQQLTYKINQIKLDADEHDLVIDALKPLDPERKCFRMVDAIVVERTVKDVLPAVQKNKDSMAATMATLETKLKEMQGATDEFKLKHQITSRDQQMAEQEEQGDESQGGQGVLI